MANEQPSNEVELTAGEKEQLQDVVSTNNRMAQLASGIYIRYNLKKMRLFLNSKSMQVMQNQMNLVVNYKKNTDKVKLT